MQRRTHLIGRKAETEKKKAPAKKKPAKTRKPLNKTGLTETK